MNENVPTMPRWAKELGESVWERINELLHDGWDTMDIVRELKLPDNKVRSLQNYARKFGPRRRLSQFAKFKDALLDGAVMMGPDFAKAMTLIAACAVSPGVKESTQRRACELMNRFARTLARVMVVDEVAEKERHRDEEKRGQTIDANEAVRQVLAQYGVRFDGDQHGNG